VAGIWAGLIGLALTWIMYYMYKLLIYGSIKRGKLQGERGLKEGCSCPVLEGGVKVLKPHL